MDIDKAIELDIARKLIEGLTPEQKQIVFERGMMSALKDWDFKNGLEKSVAVAGTEMAAELLDTAEWKARVRAAAEDGLERLITQLPDAVYNACVVALSDERDKYDRPNGKSVLHKFLSLNVKEGD